jgi:hypothetical protein
MELRLQHDNPTVGLMADLRVKKDGVKPREAAPIGVSNRTNLVRSTSFKYYIHDGVDSCRLQLFGDFTEAEIADLTGCWETVKTTLSGRHFVVDLLALRSADDAAKAWLVRMTAEGASIRPENYLRDGFALEAPVNRARSGLLARCIAFFRRSFTVEV